jgi:hypothetical protein
MHIHGEYVVNTAEIRRMAGNVRTGSEKGQPVGLAFKR